MQHMDVLPYEWGMMFAVLGTAFAALLYAWWLARQILAYDKGSEEMQQIWRDIKSGANAYLRTQLRTVAILIAILTVAMFFSVYLVSPTPEAIEIAKAWNVDAGLLFGLARAGAFLLGSSFSAIVGFLGMNMAVEGNVRVAAAACKSYREALKIAYRSGTITGMLTDGLGLLGGTLIFIAFGASSPDVLLGFGFGGTLLALFMRVGGGIYTKAADVGADLVGKVEAGMEEDDPRNAAVIADLVGDNVGDCAGMAADIFESYEVTIVSSLILGLALATLTGSLHWIIYPLVIRGVGVISSIIGTYAVSLWPGNDAEDAMFKSYELSSAITIASAFIIAQFYGGDLRMGVLTACGVALAVAFNPLTAYATSAGSKRVQAIAAASRFGPALVILEGVSLGYLSSVWTVIVIVLAVTSSIVIYSVGLDPQIAQIILYAAVILGILGGLAQAIRRKSWIDGVIITMWTLVIGFFLYSMEPVTGNPFTYILFGVSMIGVGMLSHTGNNVSMDTFGPIADNANGIGEVAGMDPGARQIMADLDAAGNTTKAITKGVAIGSAVIAALSLYGAFFTDIKRVWPANRGPFQEIINLSDPTVFMGLLLGGMLPLLFGGLLIKAVNRSASEIMTEVRRQLRIPAIWEGKQRPDYARAVEISTKSAQAELVPVGLIAVLAPIVVGLLLKEQALGGFLAGVILSGQLQAVFMANAGGAWDNAKKYIEDGNFGGKGSENHKASVVGDTVGDPFKDTAGPALNPMIKVMNLISLILAPIIVQYTGYPVGIVVAIAIGVLAILWAVRRSDRPTVLPEDTESPTFAAATAGASESAAPAAKKTTRKSASKK
ncbi:MAG: sodium-translocating pyrophosphatase [Anaerolineae bacterium]|nr:sodium-translocating pyrophosphatase [Anaerolineae bacterium]